MTDSVVAAYEATIADLENEIAGHRAEISRRQMSIDEALATIRALRSRVTNSVRARARAGDGVSAEVVFIPARRPDLGIERPRRGEVKDAVLGTIRLRPGITGSEVADTLAANLESPAADKRKLAYSMISYLIKAGLVARVGRRLFPVPNDAPPNDDPKEEDPEELAF